MPLGGHPGLLALLPGERTALSTGSALLAPPSAWHLTPPRLPVALRSKLFTLACMIWLSYFVPISLSHYS